MTFVPSGCGATALVNQKVPSTVYKSGQVVVSIFLYFVILVPSLRMKYTQGANVRSSLYATHIYAPAGTLVGALAGVSCMFFILFAVPVPLYTILTRTPRKNISGRIQL